MHYIDHVEMLTVGLRYTCNKYTCSMRIMTHGRAKKKIKYHFIPTRSDQYMCINIYTIYHWLELVFGIPVAVFSLGLIFLRDKLSLHYNDKALKNLIILTLTARIAIDDLRL